MYVPGSGLNSEEAKTMLGMIGWIERGALKGRRVDPSETRTRFTCLPRVSSTNMRFPQRDDTA